MQHESPNTQLYTCTMYRTSCHWIWNFLARGERQPGAAGEKWTHRKGKGTERTDKVEQSTEGTHHETQSQMHCAYIYITVHKFAYQGISLSKLNLHEHHSINMYMSHMPHAACCMMHAKSSCPGLGASKIPNEGCRMWKFGHVDTRHITTNRKA
jgi:hypothetical protein